MRLYIFATLTTDEAAQVGEALEDAGLPAALQQKLIASVAGSLPDTIFVLHDQHRVYHAVLLLDDPATRGKALEELCLRCYQEYNQELTQVPLTGATSVAALASIVRAANADETTDGLD